MKLVTPEEQRSIQLRMLNIFANFCEEHHLRYSLGGGSLLGAVRHQGFIPWDDDIDVMMPRPDYEYFLEHFEGKETNTKVEFYLHDKEHSWLFAKMYDLRTVSECGHHVFIDIFPIDFFSSMEQVHETWSWFENLNMYNSRIMRTRHLPFSTRLWCRILWELHLLKHHRYLLWNHTHSNLYHRIMKIVTSTDIDKATIGGAIFGTYYEKELMPHRTFLEYTLLPFESKQYCCINNYDAYLSKHYGDYMQLPPESQRANPHTFIAYWVE